MLFVKIMMEKIKKSSSMAQILLNGTCKQVYIYSNISYIS